MKISLGTFGAPLEDGEAASPCARCGEGVLHPETINTAFWAGSGLVVIRNIPALVCATCGEEFVSDRTATGLDRMCGAGFGGNTTVDRMIVPVFEFDVPEAEEAAGP